MEVAGLVLGAIPIALYALDNYKRCLKVATDIVKYETTLDTFRLHIFIQKKQLEITLQNIGLNLTEGRLPTKSELQQHLEIAYPQENSEFIKIISQMEILLETLLDKLDIDSLGKPRWTNEPLERVIAWNWRRVKRGLGGSERDALVQQLQYWNTALSKIFEKAELPQDEDGALVQSLRSRFDRSACNAIRDNARSVHSALVGVWQCGCPQHRANLIASWHLDVKAFTRPEPLTLAVCSPDGTWTSLSIAVEEEPQSATLTIPLSNRAHSLPSIVSDTVEPKRKRRRVVGFLTGAQASASTTETTTTPGESKGQSVLLRVQLVTSGQTALSLRPLDTQNIHHITCLCKYISTARNTGIRPSSSGVIELKEQDLMHSKPAKKLILRCIQEGDKTGNCEFLALGDLLSSSHQSPWVLSRRQRFSIASAATWAVLYLCGTPWLNENDSFGSLSDSIQLGASPKSHPAPQQPSLGISHLFKPSSNQTSEARTDLPPTRIRNQVLFALGVLLTELCLNKTLESIRQQELGSKGKGKVTEPAHLTAGMLDDFDLADRESDRVYLDAGQSYGYAVQRCLRCEFPGRDSTKSFDFEEFRRHFFNGVVAPVHATYSMQIV
ncbi:hypothetical protein QBC44DRAFT_404018 [Cladorrhinum sp. PSN332]|nr:hypothetical protein QBC44DRAFT_404018 [Cladorrhinum sp. PSN332]